MLLSAQSCVSLALTGGLVWRFWGWDARFSQRANGNPVYPKPTIRLQAANWKAECVLLIGSVVWEFLIYASGQFATSRRVPTSFPFMRILFFGQSKLLHCTFCPLGVFRYSFVLQLQHLAGIHPNPGHRQSVQDSKGSGRGCVSAVFDVPRKPPGFSGLHTSELRTLLLRRFPMQQPDGSVKPSQMHQGCS